MKLVALNETVESKVGEPVTNSGTWSGKGLVTIHSSYGTITKTGVGRWSWRMSFSSPGRRTVDITLKNRQGKTDHLQFTSIVT